MSIKFNGIIVETRGVRTISGGGTNANTATGALANLGGYPASNPSGYITGVDTSSLYPRSNPSGFITGIQNLVYTTGDQTISGVKTFASELSVLVNPASASTLYVSSGLVGINTETPQGALDVFGQALFSQRPTVNGTGVILSGEVDVSDLYPRSNPSGFITGVFQPNPDYVSIPDISAKADAPSGPLDRVSSILYSDGTFPGDDISYGLAYGDTYAGQASKWNYIYKNSDSVYIVFGTAVVTGGEYPWNVSYNNGVVVTKEAAARLISKLSGSASEGSSIYAARADHVHIFPTASEVGAYSINNPSGFISGVSQFNYISGDLTGGLLSPTLSHIQGNAISAASPSAGQTLQWNGTAWVPGSIPNGGNGGGGITYYLNFGNTTGIAPTGGLPINGLSPSQLGRNYSVGSGLVQSTNLAQTGYNLICGFVTASGDPGVTDIPAGLWDFNIWADVVQSNGSANQTQFQVKTYKYSATSGTYTSLANSDDVYVYDPTTTAQYIANVTMPQTTILETDRIYIELWAKKNVSPTRQIRFYFDSLHPSHCHTTFPSVAGNGVVKVINGVMQSPASPIVDTDVSAAANIAQSKIANLATDLSGKIAKNVTDTTPVNVIRCLTSSEYDALESTDPNTIYFII